MFKIYTHMCVMFPQGGRRERGCYTHTYMPGKQTRKKHSHRLTGISRRWDQRWLIWFSIFLCSFHYIIFNNELSKKFKSLLFLKKKGIRTRWQRLHRIVLEWKDLSLALIFLSCRYMCLDNGAQNGNLSFVAFTSYPPNHSSLRFLTPTQRYTKLGAQKFVVKLLMVAVRY